MTISISFADLAHTNHFCNTTTPYGISLVAAYAIEHFEEEIDAKLFKLPSKLSDYLEESAPQIACFSSFTWGFELSYAYAERIKKKYPETIIVFGGPNYPVERDEQDAFLVKYPAIDFYICRDGEIAFTELLRVFKEHDFDVDAIKAKRIESPSCHYHIDGDIVRGPLTETFKDLDRLPSPYLMGLLDEFLEDGFTPLNQTTRGCPFFCTFCEESDSYFNKIRRYSLERVRDELHYIAKRAKVPLLKNADSNFGMFKQDLDVCRELVNTHKIYGWPKLYEGISGKNQKERLIEAARILAGAELEDGESGLTNIYLSAAVQSMDPEVLKNINRANVSVNDAIALARAGTEFGSNSVSEVILCLPGDTKDAHIDALFQMMECGISKVRAHQLVMLPGAELATKPTREKYDMKTVWRAHPNTVIPYQLFGETFYAPGLDEICVANSTMNFDDYLECRVLCLTIEVFYNEDTFKELLEFLVRHDISLRTFLLAVNEEVQNDQGDLGKLYNEFCRESREIFETKEDLLNFLNEPEIRAKHEAGEMGNNEQMMYRAIIRLRHAKDLHDMAFKVAHRLLDTQLKAEPELETFLDELEQYSLARRTDMFSTDKQIEHKFHYDFIALEKAVADEPIVDEWAEDKDDKVDMLPPGTDIKGVMGTAVVPFHPEGIKVEFKHTKGQKEYIDSLISTYGLSDQGLGNIFGCLSSPDKFYRQPTIV